MARKTKRGKVTLLNAADKANLRRIMKKVRAIKIEKLRRK